MLGSGFARETKGVSWFGEKDYRRNSRLSELGNCSANGHCKNIRQPIRLVCSSELEKLTGLITLPMTFQQPVLGLNGELLPA